MLVFGEIDCRFHILQQAEAQQRRVEDEVSVCVERYSSMLQYVHELGYRPAPWGVVATGHRDQHQLHPDYPHHGTVAERSAVSRQFNELLAEKLGDSIPVVSIFVELVHPDDSTRWEFCWDECNLSQDAMPLALRAIDQMKAKG
ncbi:MAG: hypothetical protein U1E22_11160 [Coriobacteriia bacterium]|nr:hypothetical protein [Coriobacteriia bacterium]